MYLFWCGKVELEPLAAHKFQNCVKEEGRMRVIWVGGMDVPRAVLRHRWRHNPGQWECLICGDDRCWPSRHRCFPLCTIPCFPSARQWLQPPSACPCAGPWPRFLCPGQWWWFPCSLVLRLSQSCLWSPWQGTSSQSYESNMLLLLVLRLVFVQRRLGLLLTHLRGKEHMSISAPAPSGPELGPSQVSM